MSATAQNTAFETIIGLEIHVQLATRSKMFCSCPTVPLEGRPNTSMCPVCTGQPGVLPTLNRQAVELALRGALALNCSLNPKSVFARKNYFYPDLPKGYQISQYDKPLAEHGFVDIEMDGGAKKRIGITRVHMEEDAGKLLHAIGNEELNFSLVDFNRCGFPLIEIVSEPDMRSPEEAYQYLTVLKSVMQWTGVSTCDMEKGELRVDVNISLRPFGQQKFGTKVEMKNLNSFKAVKDSLYAEMKRQAAALEAGEKISQETRLWDDKAGETRSMRSKEDAHDYRYFPEPDLVPLAPSKEWVDSVRAALPELPAVRKERFTAQYSLSPYDAGVLVSSRELGDYFEAAMKAEQIPAKPAVNWMTTELLGRLNAAKKDITESPVKPQHLAQLVKLIESGKISNRMGKDVFEEMWKTGKAPAELASGGGMEQVSDSAQLEAWVKEAAAAQPKAAADYKAGNEKAAGPIVGFVMKKSRGKANPAVLNDIIKKVLTA